MRDKVLINSSRPLLPPPPIGGRAGPSPRRSGFGRAGGEGDCAGKPSPGFLRFACGEPKETSLSPAGRGERRAWLIAACMLLLLVFPQMAWAGTCNGTNAGVECISSRQLPGMCVKDSTTCQENADVDGTCDDNAVYNIKKPDPGTGIVATIVKDLKDTLEPMSQKMFEGIAGDSKFHDVAVASMTLYVIIYALMFTFGMVQLTVYDFFIRMVKISVVAVLIKANSWALFSQTFVHFFNDGTDQIITQVSSIVVNGDSVGGQPFDWMDNAIVEAVSTKMLITIMATALTGPYGAIIVLLLGLGLYAFIKAMLNALWIYIMALVMRTLLFGLAPLFLACVMFARTRQLFDGWLNQVVNSCLQPIFLFTFFSFFVQLIKSVLDQVVALKACWTDWSSVRGATSAEHWWRFAVNCDKSVVGGIFRPYDGTWGYLGPDDPGCGGLQPVNPVGIMLPITLWILADLAKRFNHIVVQIAKDIANASTSFEHRMQGFGGGAAKGGGNAVGGGGGGRAGGAATPAVASGTSMVERMATMVTPRTGPPPAGPGR